MPRNTKLEFDVFHPYDAASHISLLSTISIFFKNSYMRLSLFFPPFHIIVVDNLKNISEFFKPSKLLFMLKIFLFL